MNIRQVWDIIIATGAVAGVGSAVPPSTPMDIVKIVGGVALLAGVGFMMLKRFCGHTSPSSEDHALQPPAL